MAHKYVPDGCWLHCNKGVAPTQLRVTNNQRSSIYGDSVATEADLAPNVNIMPFGACSITHGPCQPQPMYWDKCIEGVKVNGKKLIIGEAKMWCSLGGQAEIFYSKADAMAAASRSNAALGPSDQINAASLDDQSTPWNSAALLGAGLGTEAALNRLDPFFRNYHAATGTVPSDQIRWSQKTAGGVFSDGRTLSGTRDAIMRNGGNARGVIPPLETVRMSDGSYTSLDHRRGVAAVEGGAKDLPVNVIDGQREFPINELPENKREAFRLDKKDVNMLKRQGHQYEVGDLPKNYEEAARFRSAKQGGSFPVEGSPELPRVTKVPLTTPSRATLFIGGVAESIQSNGSVARANEFLLRNSGTISRYGRVVGRGAIVIGVATDLYNIHNAYQTDGGKVGTNTKRAVGSAAGALAGGLAGAKLGAMIGTVGGPVGVVVGGIVGGIVGGVAGALLGDKIGGWF
jgi:hypothetical protein